MRGQNLILANRRIGEIADSFITALYRLAEHCAFSELHDKLIRDHIIVRIKDTDLSEKLQLDPSLDLQKAVNIIRQRETVKKQQATLRGIASSTEGTIDAVHKTKQTRQNSAGRRESRNQGTQPQKCKNPARFSTSKNFCTRCGKAPHSRHQWSTREATCHNCSKKGCFKSMGRHKNSAENISDEEDLDTVSL